MRSKIKMSKGTVIFILAFICAVCFSGCQSQSDAKDTKLTKKEYEVFVVAEESFLEIEANYVDDEGYVEANDIDSLLDTVADYSQKLVDSGTISYYCLDEGSVYMEFTSGITYLFVPQQKDVLSVGSDACIKVYAPVESSVSFKEQMAVAELTRFVGEINGISSFDGSLSIENSAELLSDYTGKSSEVFMNEDVTLNTLKGLGDEQIIIWEGHGAYNEEVHSCLTTSQKIYSYDDMAEYMSDIEEGNIILTTSSFDLSISEDGISVSSQGVCITSKFIDKYIDSMDSTIIYLGACYSGKDSTLADSFLNKGASAVIGYTDETQMWVEILTRANIFYALTYDWDNSLSLEESIDYAKAVIGNDEKTGSELVTFPSDTSDLYLLSGIEGVLIDDSSECVIQGATISLYKLSTVDLVTCVESDDEGYFYMNDIEPGEYTIIMTADGYEDYSQSITVTYAHRTDIGNIFCKDISISVDEATTMWEDFVSSSGYSAYIETDSNFTLEYVITDLNADGIPELLIQSTNEAPFYNTWTFVLDKKNIILADETYGYGSYRYSPSYNAIVGSPEWQPFEGTGYAPFYRLQGTDLNYMFQIEQDEGIWYYVDEGGSEQELDDEERAAYFDDVVDFDWIQM